MLATSWSRAWLPASVAGADCALCRRGASLVSCGSSSGRVAKIGAGCGPFCRNSALVTMAQTAIVDMRIATNSRGCSLIAAASRPALSRAADSLRERLGTFLHPVIWSHGRPAVALGHQPHGMICRLEGQPHGHARPLSQPTLDFNRAAVQPHQALDDREAKARAVMATIAGGAPLEKSLAEAWQI